MPRSHIELKCRTILPFNLQDVYRTALFQRMSTMRYTCFPRKDKNTHRYQALDININNESTSGSARDFVLFPTPGRNITGDDFAERPNNSQARAN